MFKKSLLSISIVAALFTGCSSQSGGSTNPESLAVELCEAAKVGDISVMIKHASDEAKPQLEALDKMLQTALATEEGKKAFEQGKEQTKNVDCKATNMMQKQDDGSYFVSNASTQQSYALRQVNGTWKLYFQ